MKVAVNCPKCHKRLILPSQASGQQARCPACQEEFPVPSFRMRIRCRKCNTQYMIGGPAAKTSRSASATGSDLIDVVLSESMAEGPAPEPSAPVISTGKLGLMVRTVTASGVAVGFQGPLLRDAAFRASMPLTCIGCRQSDPKMLFAKLLAWEIDSEAPPEGEASSGGEDSVGSLLTEAMVSKVRDARAALESFRRQVLAGQTARDVVDSIRPFADLEDPLNHAMPYFICNKCEKNPKFTLAAKVVSPQNGMECQVALASGEFALDWVARVNGICDQEYHNLEAALLKLDARDWQDIPNSVRRRLAGWFEFLAAENLLLYLKDSDLQVEEEGTGGIILTDKRLVYSMKGETNQARLDEKGSLVARPVGEYVDLSIEIQGHQESMIRLTKEDAHRLFLLLDALLDAQQSAIAIVQAQEPSPGFRSASAPQPISMLDVERPLEIEESTIQMISPMKLPPKAEPKPAAQAPPPPKASEKPKGEGFRLEESGVDSEDWGDWKEA